MKQEIEKKFFVFHIIPSDFVALCASVKGE